MCTHYLVSLELLSTGVTLLQSHEVVRIATACTIECLAICGDGSMELKRGSEKALTHQTIRKFIKKNKLKNRMKVCQKKVSASLGHNSKAYGKLILSVEISKKTPLEIKIKKSRLKSKELMQCVAKVLQSIKPFKHSLSFKAKAIVHVNFANNFARRFH